MYEAQRGIVEDDQRQKSRVDKKMTQIKRAVVVDDDGWGHVVGGKTRKATSKKTWGPTIGDFTIGEYKYAKKALKEVTVEYEKCKKAWDESEACNDLKEWLKRLEVRVENVVVLGMGSFQHAESKHARSAMTQLAGLETLLEALGIEGVQIIQQDPAFTELDRQFLALRKQKVVADPDAFSEVKESTLVYAIHCYPDVYEKTRAAAIPAVMIGNNLSRKDDKDFVEKYPDLQKLYDGLDLAFAMPQFREDFNDTVVFTRKGE